MSGLRIGFDYPVYLWLLALLPLLWLVSFRSLAALGPLRRFAALALRSAVAAGIVLALAGIQLVWTSDRTTVMYLLDQSESIPAARRQLMLDFVIRDVRRHRDAAREDRAGIIVFGREANVEIPPFDDDIPDLQQLESYLGRTDATNLEAALKLAQAVMPEDTARRVVVVTDGNENLGDARRLARRLADTGVGIDVVPVPLETPAEVLVEKIDLPPDVRRGQPVEARIVVSQYSDEDAAGVSGRLVVTREIGSDEQMLLNEPVTLRPGKNVFPMRHEIEQPAPYTYRARFVPDDSEADALDQNNEATAYTYVRGQGRVLLVENAAEPDQYALLVDRLRTADIEVVVQPSTQLFSSLAELQGYDAVILAGVPRTAAGDDSEVIAFSDQQIEMLVRNTQQLGAGLLMIGGQDALGAGGWAGTELEKAMPVNFEIRNTKVRAVGALAMIMHASEMAQGNYWQKQIAKSAIEALGPADYCGVLHWGVSGDQWLWGGNAGLVEVGPNRRGMFAAVGRMTPGDMPYFDPAMRMALAGLNRSPASLKHCIIISDGDPSDPNPRTVQAFADAGIKISTVAIAAHGLSDSQRLQNIAQQTGGKYYAPQNPKALPKIFQHEARRVARPLVFEPTGGATPQIVYPHQLLEGVDRTLPPITGFVLTETKDSALAQVLIQSPQPENAENATVLAVWTYGLGRTAVLTTDAGNRWATSWADWEDYDRLFSQLVRWLMRPTGDTGKFTMATRVEDGEVRVVVSALDKEDEFLNFLDINASALGPDLEPIPLRLRQTAPGRYVGSLPADQAGSYFLNVIPEPGAAPLTTGVTVPYSEEFRVREENRALLESLAQTTPRGGRPGAVTAPLLPGMLDGVLESNPFRGGLAWARSFRDAWPFLVFAACLLFFFDVLVRRVAIDFGWLWASAAALVGRGARPEPETHRLDALRSRKAAVSDELQRRRASTRFEPEPDAPSLSAGEEPAARRSERPAASEPGMADVEQREKSYTERLLDAKRSATRRPGSS